MLVCAEIEKLRILVGNYLSNYEPISIREVIHTVIE